ncbi:MAG: hypothetical protein U0263_25560 [Polyangiaceae bacterium]
MAKRSIAPKAPAIFMGLNAAKPPTGDTPAAPAAAAAAPDSEFCVWQLGQIPMPACGEIHTVVPHREQGC